jgi:hypothetical protein
VPPIVAINHFTSDTAAEHELIRSFCRNHLGVEAVICRHWAEGGAGTEELARKVVACRRSGEADFAPLYPDVMPLWDKLETVAREIYGAAGLAADAKVRARFAELEERRTWRPAGLRGEDAVFLLGRPDAARRALRPYGAGARTQALGRCRLRRRDLRGHHDDARPAARACGRAHPYRRARADRGTVLSGHPVLRALQRLKRCGSSRDRYQKEAPSRIARSWCICAAAFAPQRAQDDGPALGDIARHDGVSRGIAAESAGLLSCALQQEASRRPCHDAANRVRLFTLSSSEGPGHGPDAGGAAGCRHPLGDRFFLDRQPATVVKLGTLFAEKQILFDRYRGLESLMREVSLAETVARSPAISNGRERERSGQGRARPGRARALPAVLQGQELFHRDRRSGNYYFNDKDNSLRERPQALHALADNPRDGWYYKTAALGSGCHLNVDHDDNLRHQGLDELHHPQGERVLGIIGTGVDLTQFIREVVDIPQTGVQSMFVDRNGAVQAHRDPRLVDFHSLTKDIKAKKTIFLLLDDEEDRSRAVADDGAGGAGDALVQSRFMHIDGHEVLVGVGYLDRLGWFNITVMDVDAIIDRRLFAADRLLLGRFCSRPRP